MKKEKLLILFTKYPNENSKSRIAELIGSGLTEKFCFACLNDLIFKIKKLKETEFIIVPNTEQEAVLFTKKYNCISLSLEQMGIDPNLSGSEIFYNLFSYFLKKYQKVTLIPMDIPHVDITLISDAFNELDLHEQVFGPEENGGVYLMGLKKLGKNIFENVRWSSANSFNDLISNCNFSSVLETFFDLNILDDLSKLDANFLSSCPDLTRFINMHLQERLISIKR